MDMNKQILEALSRLIEGTNDRYLQEEIAKIEGYIYGLLEALQKK